MLHVGMTPLPVERQCRVAKKSRAMTLVDSCYCDCSAGVDFRRARCCLLQRTPFRCAELQIVAMLLPDA
jgi:hypothetical protein